MGTQHAPGSWEGHVGEDYAVVMLPGECTDNASIHLRDIALVPLIEVVPDLLAFVKRIAKRDPVFAKGAQKQEIADARALVAKAERLREAS